MDRRAFLGLAGGLLAVPLAARRSRRREGLSGRDPLFSVPGRRGARIAALERAWLHWAISVGRAFVFVHRYADDAKLTRVAELAAELVQAGVDVVVTATNPTTAAMMKATSTVPL